MLSGIKTSLSNVRTIKTLCESAENYALKDQQRQAGAEHFLLAAIDLPDNTARLAFREVGTDALPSATRSALNIGKPCAPLG
ncbi:Clp protease N-terminal domain-containing protein [Mesorhizobium sp.]|uniref:Clp protease N-terminal domain-containing protein n=1 Tax=Mesorhizobium sp. TaxID=1871066 RepID=UPI00257F4F10|nr:Clp protease N-terminal domain-containing protein [Mesorhizobium sp.]